ncbi:pilus assembly protein TadE [Croceicoccus estronivorus]|uniref:TadE/TadG family type IV pilus assembly protein n=1 Tax=Croceicoccus estronivorus TaxID=1172626 RepID=UPI000833DE6F|nr:TadE/TadG family type IV pilus assembly protein [Croceicoccus estronivorus]OCC24504.1 pilus assembly protein TadE [Croceicoccus estronivorus]
MPSRRLRHVTRLRKLVADRSGAAIPEFALAVPIWLMLLMGVLDLGQLAYAKSVLNGAVQDAARSSSLETADTAVADDKVERMVSTIAPHASLTASRLSYYDFADIGRPEAWNDADSDGICNNGETYTDENGNGQWDADIGGTGNGGANDVVLYTVTITYERLFKMPFLPGSKERSITATAVKKNQPYANQDGYGSEADSCD